MKLKIEYIVIILFVILFNIFYFILKNPISDSIISSFSISLIPYLLYQEILNKIHKETEEEFTRFLLDLAQLLKSGLPISVAIKQIEKSGYKRLQPLINNLSAKLDWGIGLKDSLISFAEESENPTIKRYIKTILDIYESGGKLEESIEANINSYLEINKIKEKKRAEIHENIIHSYLVFIFFLGIVYTFNIFLLPFLQISIPGQENKVNIEFISLLMYHLSIIQAIFAGLAMGKMYENSYKAGAKYILIFLFLVIILFKVIIPISPKNIGISILDIGKI